MTKEFSFDIAFEKFNDKKRIDLNSGLNVFYGESGSGKTELINSFLGNKNFETKNFIITSKKYSASTISSRFRNATHPVVGFIKNNNFHLDFKSIIPSQEKLLLQSITEALD